MGRFKRYRTAWSRLHRSKGFGIHSPFAYHFVVDVLRERLPYYAYDEIAVLRRGVIAATTHLWRHPRIISFKNAKMIYRIVNFFNPQHILQVGTSYGISTACALAVSRGSRLWLYESHLDRYPVVADVLAPLAQRVVCHDRLDKAVEDYCRHLDKDEVPFVIVNDVPLDSDVPVLIDTLHRCLEGEAVIIMRNLSRKSTMKQLWLDATQYARHGQAFTNEKLGIMVVMSKLQRQDFFLWF